MERFEFLAEVTSAVIKVWTHFKGTGVNGQRLSGEFRQFSHMKVKIGWQPIRGFFYVFIYLFNNCKQLLWPTGHPTVESSTPSTSVCLVKTVRRLGSSPKCFTSYLSEQPFSVAAYKYRSFSTSLTYGVPQGSVLKPLVILLYLLHLQHFLRTFQDICYHSYTFSYIFPLSLKDFLSCRSCRGALTLLKGWVTLFSNLIKKKQKSSFVPLTDLCLR